MKLSGEKEGKHECQNRERVNIKYTLFVINFNLKLSLVRVLLHILNKQNPNINESQIKDVS